MKKVVSKSQSVLPGRGGGSSFKVGQRIVQSQTLGRRKADNGLPFC